MVTYVKSDIVGL